MCEIINDTHLSASVFEADGISSYHFHVLYTAECFRKVCSVKKMERARRVKLNE